jgi:hypothetical protein
VLQPLALRLPEEEEVLQEVTLGEVLMLLLSVPVTEVELEADCDSEALALVECVAEEHMLTAGELETDSDADCSDVVVTDVEGEKEGAGVTAEVSVAEEQGEALKLAVTLAEALALGEALGVCSGEEDVERVGRGEALWVMLADPVALVHPELETEDDGEIDALPLAEEDTDWVAKEDRLARGEKEEEKLESAV